MSKVIGIDLGTTNSCVAMMDGSQVRVLENSEGTRTTPSIVAFLDGERLVGSPAKRQAVTNPENTIFGIKRLIGRRIDDTDLSKDRKNIPFNVVDNGKGAAWIEALGKEYSPSQISAFILGKMKKTAETRLGAKVTKAVITVPAYFNDAQRQATKDAGKIAGLEVERIINEPTAAALAYGLDKKDAQTIAVYDLGGGTLDVTILEMYNGLFEVKATNGDTFLGGEDFDMRIVNHLSEAFKKEHGVDLTKDAMALQRLKESAEKAKIELTSTSQTEINQPFISMGGDGQPLHMVAKLTRAKLESLVRDLIKASLKPCKAALKDAKLTAEDIDEVVLVGGMTRMPKVIEEVSKFFDQEPHQGINPDEAVAMGAAIQAGIIQGDVRDLVLLDVTPLSLGIATSGGLFNRLIGRNTTIPTNESKIFTTTRDNQSAVHVRVFQGEREMAEDNNLLGDFILEEILPAPYGVPQIEVTFNIDANGIISVRAKDLGTDKEQKITIQTSGGLSEKEIEIMIKDAEENAESDKIRRELVEMCNQADRLISSTETLIRDHGDKVDSSIIESIEIAVSALKDYLVREDVSIDEIQVGMQKVTNATMKLGEAIYKSK